MTRLRVPRWLAVIAGVTGSLIGIATNLYSEEFRAAIAAFGSFTSGVLSVLATAVVASGATTIVYRWLSRRRLQQETLVPGEIEIEPGIAATVNDETDVVVGRSLKYLEVSRDSPELIVFLHGLGLDAHDFRPYMVESRFHCVALTLYGFSETERHDMHYGPISLESHVQLLAYALVQLKDMHPKKRLTLVGFSFGADMIFFLAMYAPQTLRRLSIHRAILLDPNVNRSTTTISSQIEKVDPKQPLGDLVKILDSADNVEDFRSLCEYLYKITSKNFAQIQRHAQDVLQLWPGEEYHKLLDRIALLMGMTAGVHMVLSHNYERHVNPIVRAAVARGIDENSLECSTSSHFDLIDAQFLKGRLEGVL